MSVFIFGYLLCLFQLARAQTTRQSFYLGLGVGFLAAAPQLNCFWVIFGPGSVALWLLLAFWIGLFAAISRLCLVRFGTMRGALLVPFIWTGLEYFRSELYYLRFSWLNAGYAFSDSALLPCYKWFGMYGVGFLAMAAAVFISLRPPKQAAIFTLRLAALAIVMLFSEAYGLFDHRSAVPEKEVMIAGVQLEFPTEDEVVSALDELLTVEPATKLFVLSEYTFDGPVPEKVRAWCRQHEGYLVIGGKDPAPNLNFYDTAFVIGPSGEIIFRQVKSVPIQFFKDGLPATEQKLWDSPWGKIGICICYDLSYRRVTDRLIGLGAQALIVPTMDVMDWGRRQHELHARVAPIRAAEYRIPIFRVASSGISQWLDHSGRTVSKAGFPGQRAMIGGGFTLAHRGSLPLDRWLAPLATGVTVVVVIWLLVRRAFGRLEALSASKNL